MRVMPSIAPPNLPSRRLTYSCAKPGTRRRAPYPRFCIRVVLARLADGHARTGCLTGRALGAQRAVGPGAARGLLAGPSQDGFEELTGRRARVRREVLRRSDRDHVSAFLAALGAEVDQPVG